MAYKKPGRGLPLMLIWSALVGIVVTIAIALVAAFLISAEMVEPAVENTVAMLGLLIGAATAALIAAGQTTDKRIIICMAGAAAYFLALVSMAAMLFDGVGGGVGVSALLVFSAGFAVALLGLKRGKRPKYRMPKRKR